MRTRALAWLLTAILLTTTVTAAIPVTLSAAVSDPASVNYAEGQTWDDRVGSPTVTATERGVIMTNIRNSWDSAGIDLLAPDGAILCAVYPGHAEGTLEGELIEEMLSKLDRRQICATKFKIVNSPTSPFFFLIEKK